MSSYLVTGGTGFIGGYLVKQLAGDGHEVFCLTRRPRTLSASDGSVQWIHADLLEPESYGHLLPEIDYVVHCAGIINSRRPEEYFETNVTATQRFLEACIRANAPRRRFVLMSSIAAMGPNHTGDLLSETDPCRPESEYGKSKLRAEEVAVALAGSVPLVIIRPSFVYGREDMRGLAFLQAFWQGTRPLAPSIIKAFSVCHVSDLVDGCLQAMNIDVPSGDVFIMSDPEIYTWVAGQELLLEILRDVLPDNALPGPRESGRGQRVFGDLPAAIQQHWGCDIAKARRVLGFSPKVTFRSGARDTIKWYRENGKLPTGSVGKETNMAEEQL